MKSGNPNFLEPPGPLQACNGTALPFTLLLTQRNVRYQDDNILLINNFACCFLQMWKVVLNDKVLRKVFRSKQEETTGEVGRFFVLRSL